MGRGRERERCRLNEYGVSIRDSEVSQLLRDACTTLKSALLGPERCSRAHCYRFRHKRLNAAVLYGIDLSNL